MPRSELKIFRRGVKPPPPPKPEFYEKGHKDGEDKIEMLINGEEFTYDRTKVLEGLNKLKAVAFDNVEIISPENRGLLNDYSKLINQLRGTEYFTEIEKDIKSVFKPQEFMKARVGSVASFLTELYPNTWFSRMPICDPRCSTYLLRENSCRDSLLIFTGIKFQVVMGPEKTNVDLTRNPAHTFIYVTQDKFKGFRPKDIEFLNKFGAKHVTIITSNMNGEYTGVIGPQALEKVPMGQENTNSSYWGLFWILLVIFNVLLIIVAAIMYYRKPEAYVVKQNYYPNIMRRSIMM
jgi:hypothetical protein